jgi:tetratricopeptide (TPR) repeat protein
VIRLAEFLDSEQVIFGNFSFTPPASGDPKIRGSIRITAQTINLREASRGPDFTEIGPLQDLARLQTHLAWQTFKFLRPESAPTDEEFRTRRPEIRLGAIEYYTRGLLADTPDQQLKLFQSAVGLDPTFSPAHFHIGRIQFDKKSYRTAAEHLSKVAPFDHRYRRAHFLLGLSRFFNNDFKGAQHAFRGVAESVPLNEVWNNLGAAQSRLNLPEALSNFQKALEGDPADPDYHFNVGYALFKQGKLEQAAERFRAVLDRDPDDAEAILMLGRCLQPANARPSSSLRSEGLERLKSTFEESAYLQLKAVLQPKR